MSSIGAGAGSPTDTVAVVLALAPRLSVTVAVMVWVPSVSNLVKVPPVPIGPSRSDVHAILAVRSPSSGSDAEPANSIVAPASNSAPLTGLVMVTVGAVLGSTVPLTGTGVDCCAEVLAAASTATYE